MTRKERVCDVLCRRRSSRRQVSNYPWTASTVSVAVLLSSDQRSGLRGVPRRIGNQTWTRIHLNKEISIHLQRSLYIRLGRRPSVTSHGPIWNSGTRFWLGECGQAVALANTKCCWLTPPKSQQRLRTENTRICINSKLWKRRAIPVLSSDFAIYLPNDSAGAPVKTLIYFCPLTTSQLLH